MTPTNSGSRVERERWPTLCAKIARNLAFVRDEWYAGCVRDLEQASRVLEGFECKIRERMIGGLAQRACRVNQLIKCGYYLASSDHIGSEDGVLFADILFLAVCEGDREATLALLGEYNAMEERDQLVRFSHDVAEFATGFRGAFEGLNIANGTISLVKATLAGIAVEFEGESGVKRFL